jgi:hypothetical protein
VEPTCSMNHNLTQLSNLHPTQFGDWLAIEFPYKTTLRHMKLTPLTAAQFPASANIYATNNDLTWTEINYWKDVNPVTASNVQTITVNATEQFKKYALVATKAAGNSSNVAIKDWQLFTESFSIDGGKVAMAQQAATGGETVMDQHGPHGRLPKAVPLKKYPEIPFSYGHFESTHHDIATGSGVSQQYQPMSDIQGGHTVTVSSAYGSINSGWQTFDHFTAQTDNGGWASGHSTYTHGGSVVDESSSVPDTTNAAQFNSVYGEWISLKLPKKIKLKNFITYKRSPSGGRDYEHPKSGFLYASNDGFSTYTQIYAFSDVTIPDEPGNKGYNHEVNSTDYYNEFRLQITKLDGTVNVGFVTLQELEYYGYEEDPPFLGDTSVDTTFKSIMNTPQTTGVQVYVDGSLGETFTNRVVGPTVSNTHTTYVSAEKYWELSGNVESNVTLEANTFLLGSGPHSVSMWFNSSNLEANVSNSCIFSLGTEEKFDHIGIGSKQLLSNTYRAQQKIFSHDALGGDLFGYGQHRYRGVSMSGDGSVFVVGAMDDDDGTNRGSAYVFIKDGSTWLQVQKLVMSDISGQTTSRFGGNVSISEDGNYILCGAHQDDAGGTDKGAAYVFVRTAGGNTWTQLGTRLQGADSVAGDAVGFSVGLSSDGTYAVICSENDDSAKGAAYVFKRTGSSWDAGQKLVASDGASNNNFGCDVSISGDGNYIIVGAYKEDTDGADSGAAYVFNRTGTNSWDTGFKIKASDDDAGDHFGVSVSISRDGTYAIIGAQGDKVSTTLYYGSAYIYTRSGTNTWGTEKKLTPASYVMSDEHFGLGVSMSHDGTHALIGAAYADTSKGIEAGAVYVFTRSGSEWTQKVKTWPLYGIAAGDRFGGSVSISADGSYILASSAYDDDPGTNAGSAYVFTRDEYGYPGCQPKLALQSNTWHNLTYAYEGLGGAQVTYLDGRKVVKEQVKDTFGPYPPFAMDDYAIDGYIVSASTDTYASTGFYAYDAFNDVQANEGWHTGTDNGWTNHFAADAGGSVYDPALVPYGYPTELGGNSGEWLKLEMPHKLVVDYVKLKARGTSAATTQSPKDFKILGSNDDVNWDVLESFTSVPYSMTGETHVVDATKGYKYVAILVTRIQTTGVAATVIGELTYYGHCENDLVRLPDPTRVLKYPHIAMTGPAQRGYVFTASSQHSSAGEIYSRGIDNGHLFDGDPTTVWHSETADGTTNHWYDGSDAAYGTDGISNFDPTGINIPGEWVQLELPHKVKISKVLIRARSTHETQAPEDFAFYGSNTATAGSWTLIQSFTGQSPVGAGTYYDITSNPAHYKYILMLITRIVSSGQVALSIAELAYYGTEEASSVPIQIGGGNIDRVANFRVYDKFVEEDQALEIWDAQKDEFGRAKSSMTCRKVA